MTHGNDFLTVSRDGGGRRRFGRTSGRDGKHDLIVAEGDESGVDGGGNIEGDLMYEMLQARQWFGLG